MAEINFCMNKKDTKSFFEYIISIGGFVIIDDKYKSKSYITTNKMEDIIPLMDKMFLVFIGHTSFFKEELPMLNIKTKGFYVIQQKYGGPIIQFLGLAEFINKENKTLGYSNISYYVSGYSKDGNCLIPASKELKDFYKKLVKYIKINSKMCFQHYKRKIWLGNNAYKSVVSGALLQNVTQETLDIIRST